MSRCFRFPPPGYDNKTHLDDISLLTKEKRKEKKHKKDKDRTKKEGKDKKDRETSKDKHKKRKDRKEKHKDKKDEEKEKKHQISNGDKKSNMEPIYVNGRKPDSSALQNNDGSENAKFVQELARRIGDEEKASERQTIQKIKVSGAGKINNSAGTNHVHGLSERIKDEAKPPVRQNFVKVNNALDERQVEICGKLAKRGDTYLSKSKECERNSEGDDRMVNGVRNSVVARRVESSVFEGNAKPSDKREAGNVTLGKRNREINGEGSEKFEEYKNRDPYKQRTSKDKDREEETQKKEKKAKEMTELHQQRPQFVEGGPKLNGVVKIKPSDVCVANNRIPAGDGNLGKQKGHDRNGFSQENGNKSNKLQRSMDAPRTTTENGRKFEPFPAKADAKELRLKNGFVEAREQKVFPLPKATVANDNGEESAKPPHPDSKLLVQILSIRKKDESLPESDEQEWLFGSSTNHRSSKKPKLDSFDDNETLQLVWDKALRIESADISALPYVLPY